MTDWQDAILGDLKLGVHSLTLVLDADRVLAEEDVLARIRDRGFDVVRFDDAVAFRYAYESGLRASLDRGEAANLVVAFGAEVADSLPFDLLQAGHRISLGLRELFPTLSQTVVAAMEPADFDALHGAVERHRPGVLGETATKDFALRHVYGVAVETIVERHDLLRVLLKLHYGQQRLPTTMGERLIELLRRSGRFADWPLGNIIPERSAFFAFLQERWPAFVEQATEEGAERTATGASEPNLLPFDHPDVRVYIDNLFVEGLLQPIRHRKADRLAMSWLRFGVEAVQDDTLADRVRRLQERAAAALPAEDARHRDWLAFARLWGELLANTISSAPSDESISELRQRIDNAFEHWLGARYASLANLPATPPVMLHHVPRALARELRAGETGKVALVVVDGLALDQWAVVRRELKRQRPRYRMQQDAVFAWIPTVTAVSRQAVFAGVAPLYFPKSIHRTASEPALWRRFWEGEGVPAPQVGYVKGLGTGGLETAQEVIERPGIRAAGLVVDTVDRIMHGMKLGSRGMHNQVRQWAAEGHLAGLLDMLLAHGFTVYLTSDHGNIEARGSGRPAEGATADMRGERVRVYPDETLRQRWQQEFPDAVAWPSVGLPEDYRPLLAPGRVAFVGESGCVVCHGGACIEEVIVPLVRITGESG